jgi:hypothetical protein
VEGEVFWYPNEGTRRKWDAGDKRNAYRVLVEKPEGENHFEDVGIDGR